MKNGVFSTRLGLACVVATVTALISGASAWAVVAGHGSPIDSNGVIHACYNPKTGDVKLNVSGTCTKAGENSAISWNQTGQPSPITAESVVQNTETDTMSTNGAWTALPEASVTVTPSVAPATITVRFWASDSCFGTGNKYAQVLWNDAGGAVVPLAAYPPVNSSQAELGATLEDSMPVTTTAPLKVSIQVETDSGSYCVIDPGLWQMTVDTVSG